MSLKIWLPLNGDLHNQGISNYMITPIEASPTFTAGKIGQCYQRTNASTQTTNGLKIQDNLLSTFGTTASVAVWVKPLGTHTHYNGTILSSGNWNAKRWAFGVSQDNSQVDVLCGGYNNYISCTVPVDQWTHLVSTFNNGVCKLYKNGTYVGEKTGQAAFNSDANWTGICRETYASGYFGFNGCINDLRIYDHCLSAAEVKEIAQGLILHYKLDSIGPGLGNPNLLKNTDKYSLSGSGAAGITRSIEDGVYKVVAATTNSNYCTFTSHNTTLDLAQGDTFTFSMMIKSPDSVKKPTVYFQSGLGYYNTSGTMSSEWSIIYYTGTWSISNLTTNIHLGFKAAPGTYYIKYLKIEKGSTYTPWAPKTGERYSDINFVDDSSGYNHNGQIVSNTVITRNTTRYSTSMLFDGVDDCIIVPYNDICPENIFTINLWFKKDALGSKNYETLFGGPSGFEMDTRAGSSTALSLYMASTRGGNAATGLQLNTWYMVTMVRDGTNERYYINGELEKEIAAKAMPTGVYRIGAWDSNTKQNYYGNISDFRIYCTPLLDIDIKQLYNVGMKIDKSQNIHSFEFIEKDNNIIGPKIWTAGYTSHNSLTAPFTDYNTLGEWQFTANSTSAGSDYITITPGIYEYDYTISVNAGNQFYIGFERYDKDKTARANSACVYTSNIKSNSDIVRQRYKGTVTLTTDGTNPIAYIALRVLNGWSGTTSGVTGIATIHNFSLRLQTTASDPKLLKQGQLLGTEFKQNLKASFYKDHIIEAKDFIER